MNDRMAYFAPVTENQNGPSPAAVEAGVDLFRVGLANLKKNWGWYLALGIVLIVLGTIAISSSLLMTIASIVLLGWLMVFGGLAEAIHAFWRKDWGGFFLDLLGGVLYFVVGGMLLANPAASAVALTLIIAMFLIIGGIFRIVAALAGKPPHWGWVLLSGGMSLALGLMIWAEWPVSGLWVIGLFVGIEMLFNGWSLVMLSLSAKNLPDVDDSAAAPTAG
ncbi:MAG: HdeD family acid-resistance protein [Candidatus Binatia bacterium]|nr:HdeD family acid-resistance protein [Candidatus Binatia bacterium]